MNLLKQMAQIYADKDSCNVVETMQFMFLQQICEGTRSFFPYYFLALPLCDLTAYSLADHAERMQQAALFRRERQVVVNLVGELRESAREYNSIFHCGTSIIIFTSSKDDNIFNFVIN